MPVQKRKSTKPKSAKRPNRIPHPSRPGPKPVPKSGKRSMRRLPRTANVNMDLTDLQIMAKERGIPFGGLSIPRLVRRINNYSY